MTTLPTGKVTKNLGGGRILIEETEAGLIASQRTGYWFARRNDIPATLPPYDPNGALLLDGSETCALVLIDFDGVWLPLSEAADSLYTGPRAVKENGVAWFVVAPAKGRAWPGSIFEVTPASYLTQRNVSSIYGDVAGRRARPDKKSVQVSVVEVP